MSDFIDELHAALVRQEQLLANSNIADLQEVQRIFVKYIILASSSFFEEAIKEEIRKFVATVSNQNSAIIKFFEDRLLARNYHSIIDWKDTSKLQTFCKFFGVKIESYTIMFQDLDLNLHFKDFLEIGILRNTLVHNNLIQQNIELTLSEAYAKYESAKKFVDTIPQMLQSTLIEQQVRTDPET